MTAFYSWRQFLMTFHGPYRGEKAHDLSHSDGHSHDEPLDHDAHHHTPKLSEVHEAPLTMLVPLGILALGALFAGMVFDPSFVGEHAHEFWRGAVALAAGEHGHPPEWVEFAPFVVTIVGFAIAYYYYVLHPDIPPKLAARKGLLYTFLYNKWYFDEVYDFLFVQPSLKLGRFLWKFGDGKVIDGLGPDGVAARVLDVTRQAVRLQTGYVYHYAFAMLIARGRTCHLDLVRGRRAVSYLLSFITFFPLLGCAAILLVRGNAANARAIALVTTLIDLAASFVLWANFDGSSAAFQFVERAPWLGFGIDYHMGVDGISMLFVVLTALLMPFCIWRAGNRSRPASATT